MNKDINDGLKEEIKTEKHRKFLRKLFLGTSLILFFICVSIYAIIKDKNSDTNNSFILQTSSTSTTESNESIQSQETSRNLLPVYLTGAVTNPGVYEVKTPIYLYEILKLAGGLTDAADKDKINLAFLINSNMMIKIPSINDTKSGISGGYTTNINSSDFIGFNEDEKHIGKININTANMSKLCELPGVGESTANSIITYREKNGNFKKIEDVMKISGIKQSKFDKIKDFVTVN